MGEKKEENMVDLWVIPFGVFRGDYLKRITRKMAEEISCDFEIQPPIHLPRHAFDSNKKKYNSAAILDYLKDVDAPSLSALGVTEHDIFSSKRDYVFSESDMLFRVGVISFLRLRQEFYGLKPDDNRFFQRALSEMSHVVGHLFGLKHCSDPYCVMYNTPTLVDLDRKGHRVCFRCKENLSR